MASVSTTSLPTNTYVVSALDLPNPYATGSPAVFGLIPHAEKQLRQTHKRMNLFVEFTDWLLKQVL